MGVKISENRRLILLISVLMVAGFLATSLASYFVSRESVRNSITAHELPLTSDNIYSEVERDLFRPVLISSLMSQDTFLRDWTLAGERDLGAITKYLGEIKNKNGVLTAFFVSERTRNYYYAGGIMKKVKLGEPRDAWYFRVRDMKVDYEINVDPDMANRDAMAIFINYRVFDYKGNFIGSVGVGLMVDTVRKLIENYKQRYHCNILFVDRKGRLVLTGAGVSPQFLDIRKEPGYRDIADRALSANSGKYQYNRNGGTVFVNARFIDELQWYLLVERSEDPSLKSLRSTLYWNLAACLLITAVVLAATRVTLNRYQARVEADTKELKDAKERAEDATGIKDKFVGLVSHNIRGPLSTVIGYLNLAMGMRNPDGSYKPEIREWLERTKDVTNSLIDTVTKTLDISRLQTGRIHLNKHDVYAREVFSRVIENATHQASEKNVALRNEIPEDFVVTGDRELLGEVFTNLVSNAIKFTKGGGSVTVFTPVASVIAVRDTGVGISPKLLPDIFKHEVLTSTPGTSGEGGTGMGLPYCSDIMDAHGGSIRAESLPEGSVFYLWFPHIPPGTTAT